MAKSVILRDAVVPTVAFFFMLSMQQMEEQKNQPQQQSHPKKKWTPPETSLETKTPRAPRTTQETRALEFNSIGNIPASDFQDKLTDATRREAHPQHTADRFDATALRRAQPFIDAMNELCTLSREDDTGKLLNYTFFIGSRSISITTNLEKGYDDLVEIFVSNETMDKESGDNFATVPEGDSDYTRGLTPIFRKVAQEAVKGGYLTQETGERYLATTSRM